MVIPRGLNGIKIRKRGLGKERKMTYKLGKEKELESRQIIVGCA